MMMGLVSEKSGAILPTKSQVEIEDVPAQYSRNIRFFMFLDQPWAMRGQRACRVS
jgi:hypothetical protein